MGCRLCGSVLRRNMSRSVFPIKGTAWMTFTIEVADSLRLAKVLGVVTELRGVQSARRK